MIKFKYLDINKQFVKSLSLEKGFQSLLLTNKLNEPRTLKIIVDNGLSYDYNRIVNKDDYFLELEIDGKKILFSKKTSNFNFFQAVGTKGQGTTENDGLFFLNANSGNSIFESTNINGNYFLKNNAYNNNFGRYKIKNFDNVITQKYLDTRSLSYCAYYVNDIKNQVDKDNGITEITFLSSSSLELDWSIRRIKINSIYTGLLSNFLNQINPSVNWVLVSGDKLIDRLDTGSSDNRELLEEICKALDISWAEVDCIQGKTTINVGDHMSQANYKNIDNTVVNHEFYNKSCKIKRFANYYPTITSKVECKKFVQEGTLFLVNYRKTNIINLDNNFTTVYKNKNVWNGEEGTEIKNLIYDS